MENASGITRAKRSLNNIKILQFHLVTQMQRDQSACSSSWQQVLIRLATSVVSEIFISNYLGLLSECPTIQPLNRATVSAHRHDELAHRSVLRIFTEIFYPALTPEQQRFFSIQIPSAVRRFADLEPGVWKSVLEQLAIPAANEMLADCQPDNENAIRRIDYSGVVSLARNIGILDTDAGFSCFMQEGLVDIQTR